MKLTNWVSQPRRLPTVSYPTRPDHRAESFRTACRLDPFVSQTMWRDSRTAELPGADISGQPNQKRLRKNIRNDIKQGIAGKATAGFGRHAYGDIYPLTLMAPGEAVDSVA